MLDGLRSYRDMGGLEATNGFTYCRVPDLPFRFLVVCQSCQARSFSLVSGECVVAVKIGGVKEEG